MHFSDANSSSDCFSFLPRKINIAPNAAHNTAKTKPITIPTYISSRATKMR